MMVPPPAEVGAALDAVDTPALIVDLDVMAANIARMADAARGHGVALRPHAKTHKSPYIARLQLEAGAVGVCCQKVGEAEAMVRGGITDVLVSNQVVGLSKLRRLAALARDARIAVCVDDATNAVALSAAARAAGVEIEVLVEIDVGSGRCGVRPGQAALALARRVAALPHLRLAGLQAYHGPAQHIRDHLARKTAVDQAVDQARITHHQLEFSGLPCPVVTGAGTGSFRFEAASGVFTEIQPGSYVFMDADYARNRAADDAPVEEFGHALFVLATVMSAAVPGRAVVDAGIKALAVDSGMPLVHQRPEIDYVGAADEHGTLAVGGFGPPLAVGDKLLLVPGHCDPTVNLHDWYVGVSGGRVAAVWPVEARGAVF